MVRKIAPPQRWTTFNSQAPNSLFFATDPVVIDCVMCDFLDSEAGIPDGSDCCLQLAADAGPGYLSAVIRGVLM
ncbi:MAG: hypothetical protein GTN71_22320 [Anaerolineae bacterium]|nr:hypothetical protein [Anaerolineae bacterium]